MTFWTLSEDDYEKFLEIKSFGKRKRLARRKQELEDELKKKFDDEEKNKNKQKDNIKVIKLRS